MLKIYATPNSFIQIEGDINTKIDPWEIVSQMDVDSVLIVTNTGIVIEAACDIEYQTSWGFIIRNSGTSEVRHHYIGSKENPYKHTEVIEIESDIKYIITAPNPKITHSITH